MIEAACYDDSLSVDIRQAIRRYVADHGGEFSKSMLVCCRDAGEKDREAVVKVLRGMRIPVKVTVVAIGKAERNGPLAYDVDCMPEYGMYVRLSGGEYLLFESGYWLLVRIKSFLCLYRNIHKYTE